MNFYFEVVYLPRPEFVLSRRVTCLREDPQHAANAPMSVINICPKLEIVRLFPTKGK